MPALILGDFKYNHYYNCSYQRFKTKGLRVQLKNIIQLSLHCTLQRFQIQYTEILHVIQPSINISNSNVKVNNNQKLWNLLKVKLRICKSYENIVINITHVHCMHKHDHFTLVYYIHQPDKISL